MKVIIVEGSEQEVEEIQTALQSIALHSKLIQELREMKDELKQAFDKLEADNQARNQQDVVKDQTISDLTTQGGEKDQTIAQLQQQLADLQNAQAASDAEVLARVNAIDQSIANPQ